jgi:hypothetical protein
VENSDGEPILYLVSEPLASKERMEEIRATGLAVAALPDLIAALRQAAESLEAASVSLCAAGRWAPGDDAAKRSEAALAALAKAGVL